MKKFVCLVMALILTLSLPCNAFAAETSAALAQPVFSGEYVELSDRPYEGTIIPRATLTLTISNLQPNWVVLSDETYYISDDSSMINITSSTWSPASCNISVGWYSYETTKMYRVTYSGGSTGARSITSEGVPAGNYKVFVLNRGNQNVTGAVQYYVV